MTRTHSANISESGPTLASLRAFLSQALRGNDFETFCLTYFPDVSRRFDKGSERLILENLLLQHVSSAEIVQKLRSDQQWQSSVFRHGHLLRWPQGPEIVGERFRRIRIIGESGPDKRVLEVEELSTGRRFALKQVRPFAVEDEQPKRELATAARITQEIQSRHLAAILDHDLDSQDAPWVLMELLRGQNLADFMNQHPKLALSEAYEIITQVALGLAEAHRKRWVHRNLKPHNIFVLESPGSGGDDRQIKLLDFGLARQNCELQSGNLGRFGHLSWLAPEQFTEGTAVHPQMDVWSLGLVAYFVLCGKHYFDSAIREDVPWSELNAVLLRMPLPSASERAAAQGCGARLPGRFDEWFANCVSRDQSQRFQNAELALNFLTKRVIWNLIEPPPPPRKLLDSLPVTSRRPSLVKAPSGVFMMGSASALTERRADELEHRVHITRPFWASTTQVTRAQYFQVMGERPPSSEDDVPVTSIPWKKAIYYCIKLSIHENLEPAYVLSEDGLVRWRQNQQRPGYRLLTEAEWEYLARTGEPLLRLNVDLLRSVAWYEENSQRQAQPVGRKEPNKWGCYDLLGNVYEWVWDYYQADIGSSDAVDPTGPQIGKDRVIRGGSWRDTAAELQCTRRTKRDPQNVSSTIGFRIARSA